MTWVVLKVVDDLENKVVGESGEEGRGRHNSGEEEEKVGVIVGVDDGLL